MGVFGDILAVIASVGSVVGGTCTAFRWYRRKHDDVLYFKHYCEQNFMYFKSFVDKLVYKTISRPLPDSRFINYDLALKNGFYANDVMKVDARFGSDVQSYQIPYKSEIDYLADPQARILIEDSRISGRFTMDPQLTADTDVALNKFLKVKPNTTDGPTMRMKSFVKDGDSTYRCVLQAASYFDQVRTNLTLDEPFSLGETVRIADLGTEGHLKDLSESIMANTIGVSAVWVMECDDKGKNDRLRFFLRPRRGTTGVFTDMLGTISGVVEPPVDGAFEETSLEDYLMKEIRREFYQESGFNRYLADNSLSEEVVKICPLAFMRELTRGGKPQFFFMIVTPYVPERVLSKYFKISYNGKEEFYSDMRSRFMMYGLSPETMTNLILAYRYIQRNQRLDYVDFS